MKAINAIIARALQKRLLKGAKRDFPGEYLGKVPGWPGRVGAGHLGW